MKNIFSIDVEDWFHILDLDSTPKIDAWDKLDSRVEMNLIKLLDEFDKTGTKVTCFFLGWVADKFRNLIKEACIRGHEIASHGYHHQLIYSLSEQQFYDDVKKSKDILEKISGKGVIGYRSPGFSAIKSTPWIFDILAKVGYKYDSSIFPAFRGHGGTIGANVFPHKINTKYGEIMEFPISVVKIFNTPVCFFGGGYLRLFPYLLISKMSKQVNIEKRPVIYYIHPREIDPNQPRLQMGLIRHFKSYYNIKSTMPKIKKILQSDELTTFKNWLLENQF